MSEHKVEVQLTVDTAGFLEYAKKIMDALVAMTPEERAEFITRYNAILSHPRRGGLKTLVTELVAEMRSVGIPVVVWDKPEYKLADDLLVKVLDASSYSHQEKSHG